MISLRQLLAEAVAILEKDAEQLIASKVAKQMGLVYKGFGRWADPKTNKIVAKTIDGKLVRIEPEDPEQSEKGGKGSKWNSQKGMRQTTDKLDAPSGAPFGKEDQYSNRRKTVKKITDYITKNKDRISGNPQAEAKAVGLMKKLNMAAGLRPEEADFFDDVAQDEGLDGVMKLNRLIDDTMNSAGEFAMEVDYLDRSATYDHPDEYASSTYNFDGLVDAYEKVTWSKNPRTGEDEWSYEPERAEPDYDDRDY